MPPVAAIPAVRKMQALCGRVIRNMVCSLGPAFMCSRFAFIIFEHTAQPLRTLPIPCTQLSVAGLRILRILRAGIAGTSLHAAFMETSAVASNQRARGTTSRRRSRCQRAGMIFRWTSSRSIPGLCRRLCCVIISLVFKAVDALECSSHTCVVVSGIFSQ